MVSIILLAVIVPIVVALILIVAINISFWLLWIILIIQGAGGAGYGIFLAVQKLKKNIMNPDMISMKDLESKVVDMIKNDQHNPDNLIIENRTTLKIGNPPTKLKYFYGHGTENSQIRAIIINPEFPDEEFSSLINPKIEQIKEAIAKLSDNPVESIKIEEGFDEFGKPKKTTSLLDTRKEKEKEQQKAIEEKNII